MGATAAAASPTTVLRVDASCQAEEVGDEALLISRRAECPVYVVPRPRGARRRRRSPTARGVVIADDGLQHLRLARDAKIVLDRCDARLGQRRAAAGRAVARGSGARAARRSAVVLSGEGSGPARSRAVRGRACACCSTGSDAAAGRRPRRGARALDRVSPASGFTRWPGSAIRSASSRHCGRPGWSRSSMRFPDHHRYRPATCASMTPAGDHDREGCSKMPVLRAGAMLVPAGDRAVCAGRTGGPCWGEY